MAHNSEDMILHRSNHGMSAEHPRKEAGIYVADVATSTSRKETLNTLKLVPEVVGCWKIEDICFDFDKAFVNPEVKDEFEELARLYNRIVKRAKVHPYYQNSPGPPITIFGHADSVGNDEYNKKLSENRAKAVFGVLTRNADVWEEIYQGDKKGGARYVQNRLTNLGYDCLADGIIGPKTKKAIKEYMDELCTFQDKSGKQVKFQLKDSDFLGNGKCAYQGCSKFNPLRIFSKRQNNYFKDKKHTKERNEENRINRRVVLFLFEPGTSIDPKKWRCESDIGLCKNRFWCDSEKRRELQEYGREYKPDGHEKDEDLEAKWKYKATTDTFACRFYEKQVLLSPCEQALKATSIGINFPWCGCGWDFGIPPPWNFPRKEVNWRRPWESSNPRINWKGVKWEGIAKALNELKSLHVKVVRWFILAEGLCYGIGKDAPQKNGKKWECKDPRKMSDAGVKAITDDFRKLLEEFKNAKGRIKLLPCLIDFKWFYPGEKVYKDKKKGLIIQGYVKKGRADIIQNDDKRHGFLDTIFKDLLTISSNYKDIIYAWDIINEPEWAIEKGYISEKHMKCFVKQAANMIKGHGFYATVGSKTSSNTFWLRFWKDCGINLFQYHDYEKKIERGKATIALNRSSLDNARLSPCIIGEFPTKWDQQDYSDDTLTESFIQDAQKYEWPLVMPWRYNDWTGPDIHTNSKSAKRVLRKLANKRQKCYTTPPNNK